MTDQEWSTLIDFVVGGLLAGFIAHGLDLVSAHIRRR
jgi:hypothetical protein